MICINHFNWSAAGTHEDVLHVTPSSVCLLTMDDYPKHSNSCPSVCRSSSVSSRKASASRRPAVGESTRPSSVSTSCVATCGTASPSPAPRSGSNRNLWTKLWSRVQQLVHKDTLDNVSVRDVWPLQIKSKDASRASVWVECLSLLIQQAKLTNVNNVWYEQLDWCIQMNGKVFFFYKRVRKPRGA